jgi:hypothetical protein
MPQDVMSGRFVGRGEELARLRELLARAAAGEPVAALVGGEAGVGKTRLVERLAATAGEQGARVLHRAAYAGFRHAEALMAAGDRDAAAAARSNRQIAQALFISPKSASVHVSNIPAKLGVATRVEAATVTHRLGLDRGEAAVAPPGPGPARRGGAAARDLRGGGGAG